jgi:3-mercaptopyruvate sulfurtransferase SseA
VALLLRRRGIERVRPLAGGFHAWRDRGYPLIALAAVSAGEIPAWADRRVTSGA